MTPAQAIARAAELKSKKNKYNAVKIKIDNITFDSQKEGMRYKELISLQRAKVISNLALQPTFILQASFRHDNKIIRAITYTADFEYKLDEVTIIEDTKGFKTEVYKIKKKMFLKLYGSKYKFIEG